MQTALLESSYNWYHDSIRPIFIKLSNHSGCKLLQITGNEIRPDFAIIKSDDLVLLELTVGFKANMKKNFDRKAKRYQQLLAKLSNKYKFYYVNLSLSAVTLIGKDSLINVCIGKL